MNLAKPKPGVPLAGSVKETVMYCDTDAPIAYVATVCTNEHCLVMICKVTPVKFKLIRD